MHLESLSFLTTRFTSKIDYEKEFLLLKIINAEGVSTGSGNTLRIKKGLLNTLVSTPGYHQTIQIVLYFCQPNFLEMHRPLYYPFRHSSDDKPYSTRKTFASKPFKARELTTKFKEACQVIVDQLGVENIGDYLEFGVYQGTSMKNMSQTLDVLKLNNVRLFGFDSFQGLPAIAAIDIENELQPGEQASSIEYTSKFLTENGIDWNRTFLIKGWFTDSLNNGLIIKHNIKKASLIMIDCTLYSSAKEALNFCIPLIKDICIIFINDWSSKFIGEKRAFEELISENPHFKTELIDTYKLHKHTSQGRIFLVTNSESLGIVQNLDFG